MATKATTHGTFSGTSSGTSKKNEAKWIPGAPLYDKILDEETKALAGAQAADISAVNKNYDLNVGAVQDNYNTEVKNTEQAYNSLYDQNAVSKIINERKIAENMANLGLTDSGLNRTQQTANQLSYANTNNQIGIQKQKAIDTLAQTMRNKITELDIKKNEDIAGIKSGYAKTAQSNATSRYNAQIDEQNKIIKAQIDEQNRIINAKNSAREKLIEKLVKTDINDQFKVALVEDFIKQYGLTDAEKQDIVRYLPSALQTQFGVTPKALTSGLSDQEHRHIYETAQRAYSEKALRNAKEVYEFVDNFRGMYGLTDNDVNKLADELVTVFTSKEDDGKPIYEWFNNNGL